MKTSNGTWQMAVTTQVRYYLWCVAEMTHFALEEADSGIIFSVPPLNMTE